MTEQQTSILVLDDDPEILVLVKRVLVDAGHEVLTADDPRDALRIVEEHRPCLIIADLMLPHMDGEDFLRSLARRGDRPPVIILSASAVREEVAARVHAEATLAKPFQLGDLRDLVARFC